MRAIASWSRSSASGGWRTRSSAERRLTAAVTVSFDNLGEVTELQRGELAGGRAGGAPLLGHPRVAARPGAARGMRAARDVLRGGAQHRAVPDMLVEVERRRARGRLPRLVPRAVGWSWNRIARRSCCAVAYVRWVSSTCARWGFVPRGAVGGGRRCGALREPRVRATAPPPVTGSASGEGVAILPFAVGGARRLPLSAALRLDLRERDHGSADVLAPSRLARDARRRAAGRGRGWPAPVAGVPPVPGGARGALRGPARAAGGGARGSWIDGAVWCAPYRDVASWMRVSAGERAFESLTLDATAA